MGESEYIDQEERERRERLLEAHLAIERMVAQFPAESTVWLLGQVANRLSAIPVKEFEPVCYEALVDARAAIIQDGRSILEDIRGRCLDPDSWVISPGDKPRPECRCGVCLELLEPTSLMVESRLTHSEL
jgi:hypothetical protein